MQYTTELTIAYTQALLNEQALLNFLLRKLSVQRVREVRVLSHLWGFSAWLEPHLSRLGGFATNQEGSGMHEIVLRKDAKGHVRFNARQTSQSSYWMYGMCGTARMASARHGMRGTARMAHAARQPWTAHGTPHIACTT